MSQPYRVFTVQVAQIERPTPGFIRISFGGEQLDDFGFAGLDQRIKVILPNQHGEVPDLTSSADWYTAWRELPDDQRPPLRTYTSRRVDRTQAGVRLVVDFWWHENPGPAAAWAQAAQIGDQVAVLGANAAHTRATGEDVKAIGWIPPQGVRHLLLVGDETAIPAIASILEEVPEGATTSVLVEVADAADAALLGDTTGVDVTVLTRGQAPHGSALIPAIHELGDRWRDQVTEPVELEDVDIETGVLWEVPGLDQGSTVVGDDARTGGACYAWLAGEAGVIKQIRRHLVTERGLDRNQVAFMGYWRQGRTEY